MIKSQVCTHRISKQSSILLNHQMLIICVYVGKYRKYYLKVTCNLKSLGPIDRKFHGHGKKDRFVLYEYKISKCSSFCKYTNINVTKKERSKKITCKQ